MNQSADVSVFGQEGALSNEQASDLQQSANQAMVIQGSESTAIGLPGANDWGGFGRGGMGGPDGMMGGPGGGMGGIGGPGGGMMGMTPTARMRLAGRMLPA